MKKIHFIYNLYPQVKWAGNLSVFLWFKFILILRELILLGRRNLVSVSFHLHFPLPLAKFWWSYRGPRCWRRGHFTFNSFILLGICGDACPPILAGTFTDGSCDAPHFHKFPSDLGDLSYISLSPLRTETYTGASFLCSGLWTSLWDHLLFPPVYIPHIDSPYIQQIEKELL